MEITSQAKAEVRFTDRIVSYRSRKLIAKYRLEHAASRYQCPESFKILGAQYENIDNSGQDVFILYTRITGVLVTKHFHDDLLTAHVFRGL